MKFHETSMPEVYRIELEPHVDRRGSFVRTFCREAFRERGLEARVQQCNLVKNGEAGTLRGIHYHLRPSGEVKIVQCLAGAIFDVLVDLRPESPSYGEWISHELRGDRLEVLYLPKGIGHAYQTLSPGSIVYYLMSEAFVPGTEQGYRWDDSLLAIPWPDLAPILSERDRALPSLDLEVHREAQRAALKSSEGSD